MMALRSCLFGALLILSVFSTQSAFAARRLDEADSAPVDAGKPNIYPKPPDDPVPAAVDLDHEPKKASEAHTGTDQLPKTKRRKTEVATGKAAAAVKPKDCDNEEADCGGDWGGDDGGGGGGGGDDVGGGGGDDFGGGEDFIGGGDDFGGGGDDFGGGGDALSPDCGQFWNGGDGGDDTGGGDGDVVGGGGGDDLPGGGGGR